MVKKYSPWIEKLGKHKYKYCQRYIDPLTSAPGHIVRKKVSITLTKKSPQAKREAYALLNKKIEKIIADNSKGTDILLQDLTDRYQKWLKDTNRPWNTRKRAAGNYKFINQRFPKAIAKNITTPMITDYLEYCLYERPRKLSNSSTRLRKVYLSNAYRYGIDHGLVKSNPVIGVRVRWKDESASRRERIENKYFTDDELRAILGFLKYVVGRLDYYYLFKFLYLTGMRISEAAALQKDNFIKKNGVWLAEIVGTGEYHYGQLYQQEEKGKSHNQKSSRAKTTAGYRQVQLNSSAVKIYQILKEQNQGSKYLFINHYYNKPWITFTVDKYLKKIARRLGINKRLTSHFFRHTYISKQAEMGTPLNVIMAQVGQADSSITKQIYTHVTQKERLRLQKNLEQMDNDIGI